MEDEFTCLCAHGTLQVYTHVCMYLHMCKHAYMF